MRRVFPIFLLSLWGTLFPAAFSYAAEEGVTSVSTALRAEPQATAKEVTTVAADTAVTIEERKGSWFQVSLKETPATKGWVRMFDIKLAGGGAASSGGGSALGGFFGGLFGGGGGGNQAQSTIGIRGLSETDLNNAAPNPAELQKMEQYKSSEPEARKLAKEAKLEEHRLDYVE